MTQTSSLAARLQALDAASSPGPWDGTMAGSGYGAVGTTPENAPRYAQREILRSTRAPKVSEGRANARLAALAKHLAPLVREFGGLIQELDEMAGYAIPTNGQRGALAALEADLNRQESSGA